MFRWAKRAGIDPHTVHRASDKVFRLPLSKKIKSGDKVFVCSLSDFWHEGMLPKDRRDAWDIMEQRSDVTFLILTKRPENIDIAMKENGLRPLPNIWCGITAENTRCWVQRMKCFSETELYRQSPVRFVSIEPMLGDMTMILKHDLARHDIDWIIVGGESGGIESRPLKYEWAEDVRKLASHYNIPFFMKQWGAWQPLRQDAGEIEQNIVDKCLSNDIKYGKWIEDDFYRARGTGISGFCAPSHSIYVGAKNAGAVINGELIQEFPNEN